VQPDKSFTKVPLRPKYVSVRCVLYNHLNGVRHVTLLCCPLQADVLAMRLMQDIAFQQAVQTSHVLAAAKAAVSLLGVRLCTMTSCAAVSSIIAAYRLLNL